MLHYSKNNYNLIRLQIVSQMKVGKRDRTIGGGGLIINEIEVHFSPHLGT